MFHSAPVRFRSVASFTFLWQCLHSYIVNLKRIRKFDFVNKMLPSEKNVHKNHTYVMNGWESSCSALDLSSGFFCRQHFRKFKQTGEMLPFKSLLTSLGFSVPVCVLAT